LWANRRWIILGLALLFGVVLVRTAWLSEDAYFTFRSVQNWVHGYGARWNVAERVQVYTHPLWFGLMSLLYFVMRHMEAAAFFLCFTCTAGVLYLLIYRMGRSVSGVALALACLTASKAFTDYSTSGLENSLSHLLLLGFFYRFWRDEDSDPRVAERELSLTCLLGGLLVINRMDLGLVLAPALVYWLWPPRFSLRRVLAIGLGFSPLIAWELISLVYYGFLVPNTAFAKLGSAATWEFELRQGTRYFKNSIEWDPITLVCTGVVCLSALRRFRLAPRQACAALGALAYLAYVFKIGGGYMSGRFLTSPLVVAAAVLANREDLTKSVVRVSAVVVTALAFMAPNPTFLSGRDYHEHRLHTDELIDDERGYRHYFAGLISARSSPFLVNDPWFKEGTKARLEAEGQGRTIVVIDPNGGYMGYAAGPKVHFINPYAITDPLLARLPGRVGFIAPGHFWRNTPKGYPSAAIGTGEIRDPDLRAYWDELSLIISGPIFSSERWAAIWRMHTGANQHLIDTYLHADLSYDEVSGDRVRAVELRNLGATIRADELLHDEVLELQLERDDLYQLKIFREGRLVYERQLGRMDSNRTRLVRHKLNLPPDLVEAGYDEFRLMPVDGNGTYRMGRLRAMSREAYEAEQARSKRGRVKPLFKPNDPQ
jgi:arabinofuranosyltransferase